MLTDAEGSGTDVDSGGPARTRSVSVGVALASPGGKDGGVVDDLLRTVAETLDRAVRVRVFDRAGPGQPARKRRDRRPVLADQHGTDALIQLQAALTLRPNTEVMDWMCGPDLWLELLGPDNAQLTIVGLLHPGWLRWEPGGDLELQDRTAIVQWLTRWAPDAAEAIAERVTPSDRP